MERFVCLNGDGKKQTRNSNFRSLNDFSLLHFAQKYLTQTNKNVVMIQFFSCFLQELVKPNLESGVIGQSSLSAEWLSKNSFTRRKRNWESYDPPKNLMYVFDIGEGRKRKDET